ncbi:MAG: organic solvent tolerance protein [Rhodobacterales bacterium RIFCSPHIGHO2_02_FULL_62_130]|nr:MAG: organic solvent tolerance protein [Rhodobacterales bacterium RIFCSPHIGHO2_02_FULL_62_130]OHC56576.1 MAG: organic solvent tolerance protein [Rhodobacterales bacterium RIFCSPHIGHO2_12_FULL_62_75]
MRHSLAALLTALCLLGQPAGAQDRATLIADSVSVQGTSVLLAEGHIEIFFKGQRLTASKILYDQATGQLQISGPILLTDGKDTVILADQAELSADLTEGLMISARLVLNEQLQLAAAELQRVDGRYSALNRVVASSCKVCAGSTTPLWEIRAKRVVHDQQERQLYFDHAQLRVAGLPVFYVPRLRMPDPTLTRATGFMLPVFRTTSTLGTGLKLPYFITLGKHRDLLLTPYLSTKNGRTVELRYRQAFATGNLTLTGAVSRDDIRPGDMRAYLAAEGLFTLPHDFRLSFKGILVSDPGYLLDYGYSEADRLDSRIEVTRVQRDQYISGRVIGLHSLRDTDINEALPGLISDFTHESRFDLLGGQGGLTFQTHSHNRASDSPVDGNGDGIADGRDVARASVRADWDRSWVLSNGMVLGALAEAGADLYGIRQDTALNTGTYGRGHGTAAVELRWPLVKTGTGGVAHILEPVAQIAASVGSDGFATAEDSALVEFDEGNLFALNRFPGWDETEQGLRANLGVNYLRVDPAGWTLGVTVGRVVRADTGGDFSLASGLDGLASDWLATTQLDLAGGVKLSNRFLLDDGLAISKAEVKLAVTAEKYGIAAGYVHVAADTAENRPLPTAELTLDGSLQLAPAWTARAASRYDFEAERMAKAGLGLTFKNECLLVDLSLSRRFTSSTSVTPTTDFGLSVELLGFGAGSEAGPSRQCRR